MSDDDLELAGYRYLYHSMWGGTTIRYNNGEEVNATKPYGAQPFYVRKSECPPMPAAPSDTTYSVSTEDTR